VPKYQVEAHLTYELDAASADDALRSVSTSLRDPNAVNVEYRVSQRLEVAAPSSPVHEDDFGLNKPVYTVAEVASIFGGSRGSIYELVRRGIKSVRIGRRVLIPRSTVAAILNGEVRLDERAMLPPAPLPQRRPQLLRESHRAGLVAVSVREPAKPEPPKPKTFVSVTDAARMLRIPVPRLRELMAHRKIYYVDHHPRPQIPLRAIENFANGLPAKAMMEENIAYAKAAGSWDAESEQIAQKLLAEWTVSDEESNSQPGD
jgi:excisionase family DNA binding protein